jgi:Tol biopolymer transport system component
VYHSINQGRYNIRKVLIDGGEPTILVNDNATQPDVSPDGRFVSYFGKVAGATAWKIIVVPIDGGPTVATYELPATVEPEWPGLRWTPDGQSLTYVASSQGVSNIWRQALSGGGPKPITDFKESRIFFFDWSRNDRELVLARGNDTKDLVLVRDFLNSN